MFSFFAYLFGGVWISEHWKAIVAVIAAIVLLLIIRHAKKKARLAAYLRQQQEEERRKAQSEEERKAEEKRREDQRMAAIQAARQEKEAEISAAIKKSPGSEIYRLDKIQTETSAQLLNITELREAAKNGFVVFDTETTGLSYASDAIVEIGAVRVVGGKIVEEYQMLVNPCCLMPPEASSINHITDDMLIGQPKIWEVLPSFLSFVGDSVLVAHNVRFDEGFISQACMRNRFRAPSAYFDTMRLARYYPEAENKKQETLLRCAGIKNDSAHRALGDARALAQFVIYTLKL